MKGSKNDPPAVSVFSGGVKTRSCDGSLKNNEELQYLSIIWRKISYKTIYMPCKTKIYEYAFLAQKLLKYSFAYARMQIHNYSEPSYSYIHAL